MATRKEALAELEDVFQMIAAEYEHRGQLLPEDTTGNFGRPEFGKSIAEALREFWRAHRVTSARGTDARHCMTAGSDHMSLYSSGGFEELLRPDGNSTLDSTQMIFLAVKPAT